VTPRALPLAPLILFVFLLPLGAWPSAPPEQNSTKPMNAAGGADLAVFDERAAAAVLGTLRAGLEGHSPRRLLSAFDAEKMDGFRTFQDQIDAYFTRYETIRVTLRILQISEENGRGSVLAEFQLENELPGGGPVSRRQGQLRFVMERGPKGWKIVEFDPRDFFS
jgi:hypothetical protein